MLLWIAGSAVLEVKTVSSRNHIVHFSTKSSQNNPLTEYRPLPVLIRKIQIICIEELEAKLVNMLNTADDRLFDMSENSYNNAQFDAMRLLRVKRAGLISRFKQELANNFKHILGKIDDPESLDDNVETLSFENIALVKDDDLEEDIATDAMVNKARTKNRDALEHIRIRIDTLVADKSIEQESNPLEPVHICDAFRTATQTLDLDIASLLVIYKLFDRSVISELETIYQRINQFFIDKGILPELKTRFVTPKRQQPNRPAATKSAVDALPINEDINENTQLKTATQSSNNTSVQIDDQAGVLSVLQQLLANQRAIPQTDERATQIPDSQIPYLDSLSGRLNQSNVGKSNYTPVDTAQLVQALSSIQFQQMEPVDCSVQPSIINLRESLDTKLPGILNSSKQNSGVLGEFNEDMIDIVSMLFDFILDDEHLQPEIKIVMGRLQIPMLKVGLVDKTFFSNRRHPARVLLNELARAGLSWDRKDKSSQPMLKKISSTAETIIEEFNDDLSLFTELLQSFLDFKKQYQLRAEIFERRTREAEEGKAKTESARSEVNKKLSAICRGQHLPNIAKSILKSVWSHTMLLERLKGNQEAWARRVKVAKLLVWSVQPIKTAGRLEKLTSRVPILVKSLREGFDLISFTPMDTSRLFDELESCHRDIIETTRQQINQQNKEEILRLPVIDLDNEPVIDFIPAQHDKIEESLSEPKQTLSEIESADVDEVVVDEIVIEEVGFTKVEAGEVSNRELEKPVEIDSNTSQAIEQLRVGNWLELKIEGEFKRCKLAAKIASSGKYIFVNRSGMKMAEFLTMELCQYLQQGNLKILDDEALFDRALESVISNLRSMKA